MTFLKSNMTNQDNVLAKRHESKSCCPTDGTQTALSKFFK